MKRLVLFALLAAAAARAEGVREERPILVSAELFGRGVLGSVDVEAYFGQHFGVGIGFGGFPCIDESVCNGYTVAVPVFVSFNPIGNVHSLYLSAGIAFWHDNGGSGHGSVGEAQIGYQLQLHSGFMVRPVFQLFLSRNDVLPWFGLALGYAF
jgi:hypothetical protein